MRKLMRERFPSLAEKVVRRLESDETLRELCEDLEACESAAARLERPEGGSPELRREYAALTTDNGGASARPAKEGKGGVHRA